MLHAACSMEHLNFKSLISRKFDINETNLKSNNLHNTKSIFEDTKAYVRLNKLNQI